MPLSEIVADKVDTGEEVICDKKVPSDENRTDQPLVAVESVESTDIELPETLPLPDHFSDLLRMFECLTGHVALVHERKARGIPDHLTIHTLTEMFAQGNGR